MLKLLIIDEDAIFRAGLRMVGHQEKGFEVVGEVSSRNEAFEWLNPGATGLDLIILEVISSNNFQTGLFFVEELKRRFPDIPILLLSSLTHPGRLLALQRRGVEGYCPKTTPTPQLIAIMERVARGERVWPLIQPASRSLVGGYRQIQTSLEEIEKQLENPFLSSFQRAFLQGRRRELKAAEWLILQFSGNKTDSQSTTTVPQNSSIIVRRVDILPVKEPPIDIFELTVAQLNSTLNNLSDIPLEIDILKLTKKQDLLSIVLRQTEELVRELRLGITDFQKEEVFNLPKITEKKDRILLDLWAGVTEEFFGKYYNVLLKSVVVDVVPALLEDSEIVQLEILQKIPLIEQLFGYLLFQTPLKIDNQIYPPDSIEARYRALGILQNLSVQVANAVLQPLLNHFSESEEIKHEFFDRRWLSTRSILKFRNNLSWKYRLEKYINEPTAIFESRYPLFIFDQGGIRKVSIYAARAEELDRLSGVPLVVTYLLESRDAIAPRLRSLVAFLGKFIIYFLTQVVGRALGLVIRGILQGIGNALPDGKLKRRK